MVSMLIHALLMWPENIPMFSMLPYAFAEHGKAWGAWGNHGLPMNSMLFPMLPIPAPCNPFGLNVLAFTMRCCMCAFLRPSLGVIKVSDGEQWQPIMTGFVCQNVQHLYIYQMSRLCSPKCILEVWPVSESVCCLQLSCCCRIYSLFVW